MGAAVSGGRRSWEIVRARLRTWVWGVQKQWRLEAAAVCVLGSLCLSPPTPALPQGPALLLVQDLWQSVDLDRWAIFFCLATSESKDLGSIRRILEIDRRGTTAKRSKAWHRCIYPSMRELLLGHERANRKLYIVHALDMVPEEQ